LQGFTIFTSNMPGLPPPPTTYTKLEKTLTARPGKTLADACQPFFYVKRDLVDDIERDHPPSGR
jgi:hypothetical protein